MNCTWNGQNTDITTLTAVELCIPTEAPMIVPPVFMDTTEALMSTLPVSMETTTSDDVSAETTEPTSGVIGKYRF